MWLGGQENFFIAVPLNFELEGTHCLLELKVGSAYNNIHVVLHIYYSH